MGLAREIVDTRSHDFCRVYRNLVMVVSGYKRTRPQDGEAHTLIHKVPCVIFVVRRKWEKEQRTPDDAQSLPSYLLAYATVKDERVLCAVPTDVVPEERFHTAQAQAASGIYAVGPDKIGDFGTATCAVELRDAGGASRTFLLSCRHVLSPVTEVKDAAGQGEAALYDVAEMESQLQVAQVLNGTIPPGQAPIGRSTGYGGVLQPDGTPSFDAQLAAIDDPERFKRLLNGLRLSPAAPMIRDAAAFDAVARYHNFTILVPPGNPVWLSSHSGEVRPGVRAEFSSYQGLSLGLDYEVRFSGEIINIDICHASLIELRILDGGRAGKGDSGSPVVIRAKDGKYTLIGMHIAGGDHADGYHSYVIPAWQLFDRRNYLKLPPGRTLHLTNIE
jgi:hypothetical protein